MKTAPFGDVLEPANAARLLGAAAARGGGLGVFVRLALVSGARCGELLEVRWADLRWPDPVGECGTLDIACRAGGKTAHACRSVALDLQTMDMLAAWREERRTAAAASATALDASRHVFSASTSSASAWRPDRVTHQVIGLAAQTGVSANVTGLRRYSLLRMPVLGVAPDVVSRRLGLAGPPGLTFWSAGAIRAADREAALLLARELDQLTPMPTASRSTLSAATVYGSCTGLREFLEERGQAYVLRVASSFMLTLAAGTKMTCADAVKMLLKQKKGWEVRSAGKGSKGERWYAWAWLGTASPRHSLLVRRHLKTGELAFHYCFVPDGQAASKARLIRAAGLRWPVEESFGFGPGPVPGPALHRDPPARRAGHGRPRDLRRHRGPAQKPHRRPGSAARQDRRQAARRTPASSRSPSARSSASLPPPSGIRSHPATPPAGSNGGAATRHDPAGSTSAHASRATMPWSASDWLLPYQ